MLFGCLVTGIPDGDRIQPANPWLQTGNHYVVGGINGLLIQPHPYKYIHKMKICGNPRFKNNPRKSVKIRNLSAVGGIRISIVVLLNHKPSTPALRTFLI